MSRCGYQYSRGLPFLRQDEQVEPAPVDLGKGLDRA
jgi:hypothetical protein